MSKYEIVLILDPSSDEKVISEIANSVFKSKDLKIEKLERTELAYEINKSKTAAYYLVTVTATGEENNEFIRKVNISKNVWRSLSINLDNEKGINRKAKPKKIKKPYIRKGNAVNTEVQDSNKTEKLTANKELNQVQIDK